MGCGDGTAADPDGAGRTGVAGDRIAADETTGDGAAADGAAADPGRGCRVGGLRGTGLCRTRLRRQSDAGGVAGAGGRLRVHGSGPPETGLTYHHWSDMPHSGSVHDREDLISREGLMALFDANLTPRIKSSGSRDAPITKIFLYNRTWRGLGEPSTRGVRGGSTQFGRLTVRRAGGLSAY